MRRVEPDAANIPRAACLRARGRPDRSERRPAPRRGCRRAASAPPAAKREPTADRTAHRPWHVGAANSPASDIALPSRFNTRARRAPLTRDCHRRTETPDHGRSVEAARVPPRRPETGRAGCPTDPPAQTNEARDRESLGTRDGHLCRFAVSPARTRPRVEQHGRDREVERRRAAAAGVRRLRPAQMSLHRSRPANRSGASGYERGMARGIADRAPPSHDIRRQRRTEP